MIQEDIARVLTYRQLYPCPSGVQWGAGIGDSSSTNCGNIRSDRSGAVGGIDRTRLLTSLRCLCFLFLLSVSLSLHVFLSLCLPCLLSIIAIRLCCPCFLLLSIAAIAIISVAHSGWWLRPCLVYGLFTQNYSGL